MPRILVIDDSALIRQITAALLGRDGWDVQSAESGEAGIACVRDDPPDGILLDLDMPGLDGIATLERLRGIPEAATIPVAFLTAAADELPPERLRALGAAGVVPKPLDPATAGEKVREALGWA